MKTVVVLMALAAALCLSACTSVPQGGLASTSTSGFSFMSSDPYLWLEDVQGDKPLAWVRERNQQTITALASDEGFKALQQGILSILDSDARIPAVQKIGEHYYNFWKDKDHERGIWRRTTLVEYRKPAPQWETVLDLDAINKAEGAAWVWHGATCLRPELDRCLIELSPGGSDASVTREFDLLTMQWVPGGFQRPVAKGALSWIDRDNVYVYSDFGAGSLTASGYPRMVRRWARGTPLSSARTVYEGQASDVYIAAYRDPTPGFVRDFVSRAVAFYNDELLWLAPDGALRKVEVPNSVTKTVHREWLLLRPREAWSVEGKTFKAGSLLAARFDDFMRGERQLETLFEPTATRSLSDIDVTATQIVLTVLDDVKSRVEILSDSSQGWQRREMEGLPRFGTVRVEAVDAMASDELWIHTADFLTPPQLFLASAGQAPQIMKSSPSFFDASRHEAQQHFATSKDGTRVPYFLVLPKGVALDGGIPTLMNGYGGFEVSNTPGYSAGIGKGWLERGGAYVLANIRGGGEYGPAWHLAALKAKRHRAYEDFAAIAQDLVARKISSPPRIAAMGGSNGGLLIGNMLTQYPQTFGALSIEVPLLDMQRYHKLLAGASWMAEYGDPDKPEEWSFIKTFSPYHLFDAAKTYPPTLILTSTKDDRVHPGHARKMAAKMMAAGKSVYYYENIEGGHGGAANNEQQAFMAALRYRFLWRVVGQ
jgi:prolyl oligopeptidase